MYYDPNKRPDEDFGQWNDRNRIAKERYEQATNQNQPKASEPFDWGRMTQPTTWGGGGSGGGGGGGGGGELIGGGLGAIMFLPALAAFGCLYPMPFVVSLVLGVAVSGFLAGALDRVGEVAQLVGVIIVPLAVGIVAFIGLNRLEHRLARSALWRVPRGVVRLILFGIVGHWVGIRAFGEDRTLYPNPLLTNPLYIAGLIGLVCLVQFVLSRRGLRESWHERLESIGLRKQAP